MEHNDCTHAKNSELIHEKTLGISVDCEAPQENDILTKITHSMQDTLQKEFQSTSKKTYCVDPHYLYARSSFRNIYVLANANNYYYYTKNRRPFKKTLDINTIINTSATFTPSLEEKTDSTVMPQRTNPRDKDIRGQEESVKTHTFDDYLPMALSVKNFTELYTPKTIQYMWSANDLEYDIAMSLKGAINNYLSLSTAQKALYMSNITDIRNVTEDDLHNDACDTELLGHRGLFAKIDIPEMSIIGVYTGIFIADPIDMMILSEKMSTKHLQDYLFRIPLTDKYPKITGYQYGNRLSLINAASNYKGDDQVTFDQLCRRSNIMLVSGKSNECPINKIAQNENCPDVLFFIAGRDIPKGTQLLYDYGNLYW